jgi:hypothetical protein
MMRRCAWCGEDMGRKEPLDDPGRTDGICPACAEQMLQATARSALRLRPNPASWEDILVEAREVAQRIETSVEKALTHA